MLLGGISWVAFYLTIRDIRITGEPNQQLEVHFSWALVCVIASGLTLLPMIVSAVKIYRMNESRLKFVFLWLLIAMISLLPVVAFGPYVTYWGLDTFN